MMRPAPRVRSDSVLPWLAFGAVLALELPLLSGGPGVGDWFQFWYAGHLVWTGASPYDPTLWTAAARYDEIAGVVASNCVEGAGAKCLWLYPPSTALLFAPFGALSPAVGIALMRVAILASAIVGVVVCVRNAGLRGFALGTALVALALSQPFVIGARSGHFDGLLLAGAVLAWGGVRSSPLRFASGVGLVALKPHLLIPFALVMLARAVRERAWPHLATAAAIVTMLVAAGVGASATYPPTLELILRSTGEKATQDVATTWVLARALAPDELNARALAFLIVLVAGLAANRLRDTAPFAALLVFSLIAAPYAQTYDHLLLAPFLCAVLSQQASPDRWRHVRIVLIAVVAVVAPWTAHFADIALGTQAPSAAIPILAMAALLAIRTRNS